MRPSAGLDPAPTRPRNQSDPSDRSHLTPTTFFLTRDPDGTPHNSNASLNENDTSPVRSLKETLEEADRSSRYSISRHKQQDVRNNSRRRSTIKPQAVEEVRGDVQSQSRQPSNLQSPAGFMTPSIPPFQEPSLPSSPKSTSSHSCIKSDDDLTQDDTESQAVASSEDDDPDEDEDLQADVQNSAPQLIMPSIRMPSRRPFTDRGKQIGRFKILVAGSKGSGRTSLIKSIVQLCEDIVHVDSISSTAKHGAQKRNSLFPASFANEVFASTKSYPTWWSDVDESRILKRRKSVGDAVLERNLCFVDTPGCESPEKVLQYLEQQLLNSVHASNQAGLELVNLLSGRGGTQVDVILYLLTKETLREDCNTIKRMSQLSNVIPLISKADQCTPEAISEMKEVDLPGMALPHLRLERTVEEQLEAQAPYCVSSANGSDFDNMDASLLMSPEYVRPLVPSELPLLIKQLFEPNTIEYLRYTSAKKIVAWYASEPRLTQISSPSTQSHHPSTLNSPIPTSLSNSGVLIPLTSELSLNTSNSYALAKVADHTQREEHLAQIRLSKWAGDLQLSLQREREKYESLARSERALWLVQKMGEEVRSGQVMPVQNIQALIKANERSRVLYPELTYEAHDPLGLLRWRDTVRNRGWAALQIIGSFGVMGGVALWLAKTWGLTASLHAWVQEWTSSLFGTVNE